jgi:hypothetical protein
MGVSNRQQGQSKTFLKIYTKEPGVDQKAAFFGKQQKIDGKWGVTDRYTSVAGRLVSIEHVVTTYKDSETNSLRLVIEDENGLYQVEGAFNSLVYSIINTLASLDNFNGELSINLYVNKSNYPASYITIDGERVSWKYDLAQIPKVEYVQVGKKEIADSSKVEEFYIKVISDIRNNLGELPISTPAPSKKEEDLSFEVQDDDLPF